MLGAGRPCSRAIAPFQRGSGGRRWCRNSGFESAENDIVYLIAHPGHSAAKIGITDAGGSRLRKHSQRGWQILATVQVLGELALSIERRSSTGGAASLLCPFTSASRRCAMADDRDGRLCRIDIAAMIHRIKDLAAAPL